MKFLQTALYKFRFVAVFIMLLIGVLAYSNSNLPGWDGMDQPDGGTGIDENEAPINDWIILATIVALGYGYYAIKKKSTVKA